MSQRHRAVDRLIRCAQNRWSVPGGYSKAECIADRESSDFPQAIGGNNFGIFQVSAWSPRVHHWLRHRHWMFPRWVNHGKVPAWHEERANTFVAILWAHHANSWSAWSTAGAC